MSKENMLDYLENSLITSFGDREFAIDWDVREHRIEVLFRLFTENKKGNVIEDESGVQSEEAYIEFEDSLVFYSTDKKTPSKEDYLTIIPFDRKKGIEKGIIEAVTTYLNDVLVDGEVDLLDFLTDESIESFELIWNEEDFNQVKKEYPNKTYVSYPKY